MNSESLTVVAHGFWNTQALACRRGSGMTRNRSVSVMLSTTRRLNDGEPICLCMGEQCKQCRKRVEEKRMLAPGDAASTVIDVRRNQAGSAAGTASQPPPPLGTVSGDTGTVSRVSTNQPDELGRWRRFMEASPRRTEDAGQLAKEARKWAAVVLPWVLMGMGIARAWHS